MNVLVDANVLSEATRAEPEPQVLCWLDDHETELFLSAVTVGEIQKGVSLCPTGRKQAQLNTWLEELVGVFRGRILTFDLATAREWGRFYASVQRQGRKLSTVDSQLIATARVHHMGIATRDTKDFAEADVPMFNPWTD